MKNIEEDIRKTLSSLDNIERASPKPFLYTRLMARLEASPSKVIYQYNLKPAFTRVAMAALVILVAFNFVTATLLIGTNSDSLLETNIEETFLDQYYPSMTTIDNIEQNLTE
ncbi:MAG: hypothetical protein KAR17_17060 [Cyclobacteriaceae bacterium]|nr:hypothetical protein [Cyclobacteriaceae bacterium]